MTEKFLGSLKLSPKTDMNSDRVPLFAIQIVEAKNFIGIEFFCASK